MGSLYLTRPMMADCRVHSLRVLFAQFSVASWAAGVFDPGQAGSLQATCGSVSERYQPRFPSSAYVDVPAANRRRHVRDILRQVDVESDGDAVRQMCRGLLGASSP